VLVVSAASDVRDFRVAPLTVKVTVSGSAEDMARLQADQVHAVVNLTDIGRNGICICRWKFPPARVTLVSVDPPKVGVIVPPPPDKKP